MSMFACGAPSLPPRQLDTLQNIVTKHIQDPGLSDLVGSEDFSQTCTERGLLRWEQGHLVAALDVLNAYQKDRHARATLRMGSFYPGMRRQFKDDPRTRIIELLKRWLRANAGKPAVDEVEVRSICGLCRDILNHPGLFPARNPRSFLRTMAEVYDHLSYQLRDVLERDRSCAELAYRVLSLSRNFLSDAIAYLLLAPTDLRQTDSLPSLEVVALWQCLPEEGHPLPARADASLQRTMKEAWKTRCGGLIAAALRTSWCVRLFDGAAAEEEARAAAAATALPPPSQQAAAGAAAAAGLPLSPSELARQVAAEFESGSFRGSGLAGGLRGPGQAATRKAYFSALDTIFDLLYLLSEAFVQFHRISDGLGDYGMIRVAPWLHPFLEALVEKVQRLKGNLEQLSNALDGMYVLARARGVSVEKPAPSERMCNRAHGAIERAITGRESHVHALLRAVDELRGRSAPERLPNVLEGLGDACTALQAVLSSPKFLECVGESFPELPPLGQSAGTSNATQGGAAQLALEDSKSNWTGGSSSSLALEDEPETPPALLLGGTRQRRSASTGAVTAKAFPSRSMRLRGDATQQREELQAPPAQSDRQCRSSSSGAVGRASKSTRGLDSQLGTSAMRQDVEAAQFVTLASAPPRADAARPLVPPAALPVEEPTQKEDTDGTAATAEVDPLLQDGGLRAEVWRVVPSSFTGAWRRHDQRSLVLSGSRLRIYRKGSSTDLKLEVEVPGGIVESRLLDENVLALSIMRSPDGMASETGVTELKEYAFEFTTEEARAAFCGALRIKPLDQQASTPAGPCRGPTAGSRPRPKSQGSGRRRLVEKVQMTCCAFED